MEKVYKHSKEEIRNFGWVGEERINEIYELQATLANDNARIFSYWGEDEDLDEWLEDNDLSICDIPIENYDVETYAIWLEGCEYAISLNECVVDIIGS